MIVAVVTFLVPLSFAMVISGEQKSTLYPGICCRDFYVLMTCLRSSQAVAGGGPANNRVTVYEVCRKFYI